MLCTDPLRQRPGLVPLEQVLAEADVIFVGAPHTAYRGLKLPRQAVIDIWNVLDDTAPA